MILMYRVHAGTYNVVGINRHTEGEEYKVGSGQNQGRGMGVGEVRKDRICSNFMTTSIRKCQYMCI